MADRRLLGAMAGLARGANQASTNLLNIMQAGYKLKQDKELLDLKKKALQNDLDMAPFEKDLAMSKLEQSKAYIGYYTAAAKGKQEEAKRVVNEYQTAADFVKNKLNASPGNDGTLDTKDLGWSYKMGPLTISKKQGTNADSESTTKVLAKFTDTTRSAEDFEADLEDLKKNKTLYAEAGVDVGEVFKQALMRDIPPEKKNKIQRMWETMLGTD